MKIFLGLVPSFYRVELWNRIAISEDILVVITGWKNDGRSSDFYRSDFTFPFIMLSGNLLRKFFKLVGILIRHKYDELVISGWGYPIMYLAAFCSPSKKNSVVVESSYHESTVHGLKGLVKRIFMSRIRCKAYVSGYSQSKLVQSLGFRGATVKTKGVGIFNYQIQPPYSPKREVRKFISVGRLVPLKNFSLLIDHFLLHPELELSIVGEGPELDSLKKRAPANVRFLGYIENKEMPSVYKQHDVFILASTNEAWGLVVEEALNNGLPVLVSDKVGCAEEIVTDSVGRVFKVDSPVDFERALLELCDIDIYNHLLENISKLDFEQISKDQVKCYVG